MVTLEYGEWLLYVKNTYMTHEIYKDSVNKLIKELLGDNLLNENNELVIHSHLELYKFYLNYLNRFDKSIATYITGKLAQV